MTYPPSVQKDELGMSDTQKLAVRLQRKPMIMVYKELHSNFYKYIRVKTLADKLGLTPRSVKNSLELLGTLKLFEKPLCEWHDEEGANL